MLLRRKVAAQWQSYWKFVPAIEFSVRFGFHGRELSPIDIHSKMLEALANGVMRIPCGRRWRRHSENRLGQELVLQSGRVKREVAEGTIIRKRK
jgi:hypothetical protein